MRMQLLIAVFGPIISFGKCSRCKRVGLLHLSMWLLTAMSRWIIFLEITLMK